MKLKEPLPKEKQMELLYKLRDTNDPGIRETLILHNLKLVHWVASQYDRPGERDLDDLFQSGVIGLMRALEDYDPDKGAFSSYAVWWIRQAIVTDIDNTERIIRIPVHMITKMKNLRNIQNKLVNELEREPTLKELSIETKLKTKEIEELLKLSIDPTSLNIVINGEGGDTTLEEVVKDEVSTPEVLVTDKIFMESFKKIAKEKLTELQYDSIIKYYGVDCREHTLQEIADIHSFSMNYIRSERNRGRLILRELEYFKELIDEIEESTIYYQSIDYSQPRVTGGRISSPVENIAEIRAEQEERLRKYLFERKQKKGL